MRRRFRLRKRRADNRSRPWVHRSWRGLAFASNSQRRNNQSRTSPNDVDQCRPASTCTKGSYDAFSIAPRLWDTASTKGLLLVPLKLSIRLTLRDPTFFGHFLERRFFI